jgi:RNA polymerase sigma-70 factor (ECF subfamily)
VTEAKGLNTEALKGGQIKAFEMFFRQHYNHLCNYANSFVKDRDEAEEIVQNSFSSLWEKRESLNITGSVRSYIFSMVHNQCLNFLKHEKVKRKHASEMMNVTLEANEDPDLQANELELRIFKALQSLPEKCGMVFKLSRFEELKYAEIAEKMNISVKTVENQMGKALKLMREQLRDYLPFILIVLSAWNG